MQDRLVQDRSLFHINQIRAAEPTQRALQRNSRLLENDPTLTCVRETDIFRLRRGLCLPSASAVCIDKVLDFRLIGDQDGIINLGDFYDLILPFHNTTGLLDNKGNVISEPWWVVTTQGDVYHKAILAFAEGCGVSAAAIERFTTQDLTGPLSQGVAFALSLKNEFVLDHTLKNDPGLVRKEPDGSTSILIETAQGTKFSKFEHGTHVIAVTDYDPQNDEFLILDSFQLPQMTGESILKVKRTDVDKYLGSTPKAIAFAANETLLAPLKPFTNEQQHPIPARLVERVKQLLNQKSVTV